MYKVPKTFEAACKITGTDPNFLPNTAGLSEVMAKRHIADYKLEIIHQATVGDWKPDWSNWNKYTPWLVWSPSLGAFVCSLSYITGTLTHLGARFWFPDHESAKSFGMMHIDLINDLHRAA
ncbi:hypothetical protein J3L18_23115 [Mucilaginibacter gossypii]|uniref:hypothetical protein n=1 Tax=Mucilaginibacter gossypii TaxID=551996 RepID=UPI000DCF1B8C|nr:MULTISPECIES: hypothetical protein [Mucilaginibacter]QTE36006.1 hypothetical protein J3L18_23115 [Mucilaginibacter gossypii]RAV56680.1 hypothetical protein DIU36_14865 [Mucilaginibacter rubeus]